MPSSRRKFIKNGLKIAAGAALLDALWVERFFIELREHNWGQATKEAHHIRLLQVSDLHLTSINFQLKKLARRINELKPDLLLITGDAIDNVSNMELLRAYLGLIDHNIQKVAIMGNWEYWGRVDPMQLARLYAEHNCRLLINESVQYSFNGKTIAITGVDDLLGGTPDINAAIKAYKPSDYHVVLNHCPAYSDTIFSLLPAGFPADFILSGHTHGGQMNIFGFTPFLPPGCGRYVKGWYRENHPPMYVSRGIGTSVLPARFGARAEVAVFYL